MNVPAEQVIKLQVPSNTLFMKARLAAADTLKTKAFTLVKPN
jgi:hypothetical protein